MPIVANCAAMDRRALSTLNKLRAVNSPQRVFGGGVGGGLGDSAAGLRAPGADRRGRPGVSSCGNGPAIEGGRSAICPPSITQNQGLAASAAHSVATGPSQRRAQTQDLRGLECPRRLIACLRTPSAWAAILPASAAAPGRRPGGVVPPSARRPAPYARFERGTGNLENSPLAPACGSGPGTLRGKWKIALPQMGLGVWPRRRRGISAARKRQCGESRVSIGRGAVHWRTVAFGDSAMTVGREAE